MNTLHQHQEHEFDVTLSFAGEDRQYVENVAEYLRARGVKVFYDRYEEVTLWGKDLYTHLDDVYRNKARYCVMFISSYYAQKLWANHERQSAQARAFSESKEYILPARFDETEIPGIRPTVGYIDIKTRSPSEFAEMIEKKIGHPVHREYIPEEPKALYSSLGLRRKDDKMIVYDMLTSMLDNFKKTKTDERRLLYCIFTEGCPGQLPENIHIYMDLLSRASGFRTDKVAHLIKDMSALGIDGQIIDRKHHGWGGHLKQRTSKMVEVSIYSRETGENITALIDEVVELLSDTHCSACAESAFCRLDFSCLE